MIINVLVFFLFSLSSSLFLFSFLASPKNTGADFFKLLYNLAASAVFLAGLFLLKFNFDLAWKAILFSLIVFISKYIIKDIRSVSQIILQVLLCFVSVSFLYFINNDPTHFFILLSSMSFLGIVTFSMVLGHWYLVTPKMSTSPLLNSTYLTWFLIVLKLFTSLYLCWHNKQMFTSGSLLAAGYLFNIIMLFMRFLWGYIIIFIMSIFTYKLLKMRSLQSATGILYAETFFVFVGELISLYYYFSYGVLL